MISSAVLALSLASLALATPAPTPAAVLSHRSSSNNACAQISSSSAAQVAASPSALPVVDGQLAYNCLKSVPLHKSDALQLMNAIIPYVEWQSDMNYLKDPPKGYQEPAFDLMGGLNKIISNLKHNHYAGEYDFQADLFKTFNLAHDGHLRFYPDLLTGALSFQRNVAVVSVSSDGYKLPQIYVWSDIENPNPHFKPSPIVKINGEDAYEFMEDLSQLGVLQDPDALYNTMFVSPAFNALDYGTWQGYFGGTGRFGYIWPGASTKLTFQNGTSKTYHTQSTVIGDFTGVTDGESMFDIFCSGANVAAPNSGSSSSSSSIASTPPATTMPATSMTSSSVVPTGTVAPSSGLYGYPAPVIVSSDQVVSGYYLNNSDVAVLVMTSFEPELPSEFQEVVQTFLAEAKAAGKTKLVIDVAGNGGGYILQGYDTYRQLFPQTVQKDYTRFRESDSLIALAKEATRAIPADFDPYTSDDVYMIDTVETFVYYGFDYNETEQHFPSYDAKFAPAHYKNDVYTQLIRWNLNDNLTTTNTTFGMGMEMTGYGSRADFTQPFAAEDIILLYDGYCASTCTLFSEFMRLEGGVKSIAMGGRHRNGPMQGIGGTKGANNFAFNFISTSSELALYAMTPQQRQQNQVLYKTSNQLPINRSHGTSINARDNILPPNLEDGTPAQFIYEAADCHLFYTAAMVRDVSEIWTAAAEMAWSGKKCAYGGLPKHKRSAEAEPTPAQKTRAERRGLTVKRSEPLTKSPFWTARHGESVGY